MANKQAWKDFEGITTMIKGCLAILDEYAGAVKNLELLKEEILEDPIRRDEVKKLFAEHDDYDVNGIVAFLNKASTLVEYLRINGYLPVIE